MQLLEMISGRVLAPGATFTPLTPNGIDSFRVRDFDIKKSKAYLIQVNGSMPDAVGVLRIRSPHFHDIINGLQFVSNVTNISCAPTLKIFPELYPGDLLQIDATGTAVNTDAWTLVIFYEDVPGFKTKFVDLDFIQKYKKRVFSVGNAQGFAFEDDGNYQTIIAPDRIQDLFTAREYNRYYVLMGSYGFSVPGVMGGITSIDWGNVQIPIYPNTLYPFTDIFPIWEKRVTPKIYPVFHSENINQIVTTVYTGGTSGFAGTAQYGLLLAELTQEANPHLDAMGENVATDKTRSLSQ